MDADLNIGPKVSLPGLLWQLQDNLPPSQQSHLQKAKVLLQWWHLSVLLLLAHAPLLFANISSLRSEKGIWCLCSSDVRPSGTCICSFFNMYFCCRFVAALLLLCAGATSPGATQYRDKVERGAADERWVSLFLSLCVSLLFISIHVIGASCLRGNSPSGTLDFWGSINYIKKKKKKTVSRITMAQCVTLHSLTYFMLVVFTNITILLNYWISVFQTCRGTGMVWTRLLTYSSITVEHSASFLIRACCESCRGNIRKAGSNIQ